MNKDKKILMSKRMLKKEHARIIPELEKAGLTKEAKRQKEESKEFK
jgi:hypothetical protein